MIFVASFKEQAIEICRWVFVPRYTLWFYIYKIKRAGVFEQLWSLLKCLSENAKRWTLCPLFSQFSWRKLKSLVYGFLRVVWAAAGSLPAEKILRPGTPQRHSFPLFFWWNTNFTPSCPLEQTPPLSFSFRLLPAVEAIESSASNFYWATWSTRRIVCKISLFNAWVKSWKREENDE